MTWPVELGVGDVDLYVRERISEADAQRQMKTARALIQRLTSRPGVVLADEVGMGKTFVALTVAIAAALDDRMRRPVVVMMPPSLKHQWPQAFEMVRRRWLGRAASDITAATADNGVSFFRLLERDKARRPRVVFMTHGGLGRNLDDPWVKLAVLQAAMKGQHLGKRRSAFPRFAAAILRAGRYSPELFQALLKKHWKEWQAIINAWAGEGSNLRLEEAAVPAPIGRVLEGGAVDLGTLRAQLDQLPRRAVSKDRITEVRRGLNAAIQAIWPVALKNASFGSPLLILDEAHHLKNPKTKLASLFGSDEARADAAVLDGALAGSFERMLLLTATPFQLGHIELVHVLHTFRGVAWQTLPSGGRDQLESGLAELRSALDRAQRAALELDEAWAGLSSDDLVGDDGSARSPDVWWSKLCAAPAGHRPRAREVHATYVRAQEALRGAERLLRPWVVRHLRDRTLPGSAVPRRLRLAGGAIAGRAELEGIAVGQTALLPFLLATRAQAMVAHVAREQRDRGAYRATFAEGLASSFEAFLQTRRKKVEIDDVEDSEGASGEDDPRVRRYLKDLEERLPTRGQYAEHPKIAAVAAKVADAWMAREKVVVFCHWRATSQALAGHISTEIFRRLRDHVAPYAAAVRRKPGALLRSWDSGFDAGEPLDLELGGILGEAVSASSLPQGPQREAVVRVIRRFVRTPQFIGRYVEDLSAHNRVAELRKAFARADASASSLGAQVRDFIDFLSVRCDGQERDEYLAALDAITPGRFSWTKLEAAAATGDSERIHTVRLATGGEGGELRRRLLLGFNTPFLPEVLVASNVMAEGVNLHLNCRHVIHHDLAWNPSTIEQRTGRVDRIGAKAERTGKSIEVYLPYVAATQDEKMYQVVMDRERWFQVVMGEDYPTDVLATTRLAERVPLPEAAAQGLVMDLSLKGGRTNT